MKTIHLTSTEFELIVYKALLDNGVDPTVVPGVVEEMVEEAVHKSIPTDAERTEPYEH